MLDSTRILVETFGANVRKYRRGRNLTQEQLAEAIGSEPYYVQEIEAGKKFPSARIIARLASALAVPFDKLFRKVVIPQRPPGRPKKKAPRR